LASDIFQECNGISVKVLNLQKLVIVRMRKRRRLRKNEKVKV
jgi:urease gamma subunit